MKNIFKLAIAILLLTCFEGANAQTVADTAKTTALHHKKAQPVEYVVVKNNLLMLHQNGAETMLHYEYRCTDGSSVTADLNLMRKDGTVLKLQNGNRVYRDGTFRYGKKQPITVGVLEGK